MKNIFKELRTRYNNFLDYRDESQECFVNRKGEIVAIVDMCSLITYIFYNIFYTKTNDVDFGKEDYFRLYPNKAKKLTFTELPNSNESCEKGYTLKDILGLDEINNCNTMHDVLNKIEK